MEEREGKQSDTRKRKLSYEFDNDDAQGIPLLHRACKQDDGDGILPTLLQRSFDQVKDSTAPITKNPRQRLASLDVFRGLTIAVMILVDDAGGLWPKINHSPWHGVTLADFVMPCFLFIVGMSLVLAFKNVRYKMDAFQKASLRALKLFMLGVFLQGGYFRGDDGLKYGVDVKHIRIMGILQRISIAYVLVAFCEIFAKEDHVSRKELQSSKFFAIQLLTMYPWHWAFVLVLTSIYLGALYGLTVPDWYFNGLSKAFPQAMNVTATKIVCNVRGDLGPACNAVGFLDRTIMGINHLYQNPTYRRTKECSILFPDYGPPPESAPTWCFTPFDPEGLLSSLMAVVSCFIGVHYGHALVHFKEHKRRLCEWVASGVILNMLGFLVAWLGMPLNKPLYTFSYVCVSAGAAGLLFSVAYILVDVLNYRKPFLLLEWMGMNALLIFVLAAVEVFPAFIKGFYWSSPHNNLVSLVELGVFQHIIRSKKWSKMAYVLFEILFWCLIAGILKKRGIFWKF